VLRAIELFPTNTGEAERQLISIGEAGIPYIVESLCWENGSVYRRAFLLQVICRIGGGTSETGLIALLSANSAELRGDAASLLGKAKSKAAVPNLIYLLADKGVVATRFRSHYPDQLVHVRDRAIEALEEILGISFLKDSSRERQVRAWQHWWRGAQGAGKTHLEVE
jgi:hypothetical protein